MGGLAAFLAAALASHPLDGQRIALDGALPCVRLLNVTGLIGCATPGRAVVAPLAVVTDAAQLAVLIAFQAFKIVIS